MSNNYIVVGATSSEIAASLSAIDSKLLNQATAANQVTANASLASVDSKLSAQATASKQDVGNASLASIDLRLVSQATAAKQDIANASLNAIDNKLSGQATAAKQDIAGALLLNIDTQLAAQATAAKQDICNASLAAINSKDFATAAKQDIANASLASVDSKLSAQATAANQVTANASLASIDNRLISQATASNQTIGNASLASIDNKLSGQAAIATAISNIGSIVANSNALLGRFYVQQPYEADASYFDVNTLDYYDYTYTAGVTVNSNTSTLVLAATGAVTRTFQSKARIYYEPSKATETFFTARLYDTVNANSTTAVGLFDDDNGLFIGYNGSDIQITRRTKTSGTVVNIVTPRTSFNLNTLDGFDFTKAQLFHIKYLWFGYAFFEFSVVLDNQMIMFHREYFTNSTTVPYLQSASLPFRAQCITTSGSQNLYITCYSCNIESGYQKVSKRFQINNGVAVKTITTAGVPFVAIRISPTYPKSTVRIRNIEVYSVTTVNNQTVQIIGAILLADGGGLSTTGGTFTSLANSVSQYNVGITAFAATQQKVIYNNYMVTSARSNELVAAYENEISYTLANGSDVFVLYALTSTHTVTMGFNVEIEEVY